MVTLVESEELEGSVRPGNHVALVNLGDGESHLDALEHLLEDLDFESFMPFCFDREESVLLRFIPAQLLDKISRFPKDYLSGGVFDFDAMKQFAGERIAEAERTGKVVLGIFPFTSQSVSELVRPRDYAEIGENWITETLEGQNCAAVCAYWTRDIEAARHDPASLAWFLLGIIAHSHVVAIDSEGRFIAGQPAMKAVLEHLDPDAVPTEVVERFDDELLDHFNTLVKRITMDRLHSAEAILREHPDVIVQNPGKVVAVLLEERAIAGIGKTPGEALAAAIANYGHQRFAIARIEPAQPYVIH